MDSKDENTAAKNPMKKWSQELKAENSWTMFKLLSEFVHGFETLNVIGPCVSIFGSARTQPDNKYYQLAFEVARLLTLAGYGVAAQESWKRATKAPLRPEVSRWDLTSVCPSKPAATSMWIGTKTSASAIFLFVKSCL